ncbi:MAG: transposase [Alphaproteobacteria bacterium]|nr:transposase [Alphaproteobacteria bacterium]
MDRRPLALTRQELVRRFLLHVLPKGFMRVRHFGFLAKRCRSRRLGEIRVALEAPSPQAPAAKAETAPCAGYPLPQVPPGAPKVTARLAPQRRNPGGPTRLPP